MSEDLIQAPAATDKPQCDHHRTEFKPDWRLDATGIVAVALTLSLAKHIPDWPGATDEQIAAVAGDTAGAAISELKELTRLNRMLSDELKKSEAASATDKPSGDHPGSEFEAKAKEVAQLIFDTGGLMRSSAIGAISTALAEADANAYERGRREDDFANCERIAALEKALKRARSELAIAGEQIRDDDRRAHADDIEITLQVLDAALNQGDRTAPALDGRSLETNRRPAPDWNHDWHDWSEVPVRSRGDVK